MCFVSLFSRKNIDFDHDNRFIIDILCGLTIATLKIEKFYK